MDNFENFRARLKAGDTDAIDAAVECAQDYWGTISQYGKHPSEPWMARNILGYYDKWDGKWQFEMDLPIEYWRATTRVYERNLAELTDAGVTSETIAYTKARFEYHRMKIAQIERRQSLHLVE